MDRILDRSSTAAGVVGLVVVFLTFGLGAVSSPTFDWPGDPFSLIGAADGWTATLFNAGITLSGILLLPFAVRLWRAHSPLTGGLYAIVGLSLVGAGLVPASEGAGLHELFGGLLFFGIPVLLWVAGIVDWRTGSRHAGAAAFVLGLIALFVWLPYDFGLAWAQIGYGAAEIVSLLAVTVWSVLMTIRLWEHSAAQSPSGRTEVNS